ncbi:hypothetical protein AWJ20_616 [Sugiyamaella lignohabitans]|uniref:Exonuclease V, mitochondrial n=1 Tax=Sugiyamaella lignohabitans TaxID=796027 RepID=A0A167D1K1_9ASCO|nr:uncharacterized protein AWJ20_616 [Sugiyamaella lignohabitans]ANB12365.1 hypothetical protein AWJ20_616 [Sugiyamaella lignohabitans]
MRLTSKSTLDGIKTGYLPRKLTSIDNPEPLVGARPPTPLSLYRNNKKLNVTDISTKYCELLDFYDLRSGKKVETAAMAAGTVVHLALEKEAEKHLVKVTLPDTLKLSREEEMAKKFLDLIARLNAMLAGHAVREFYTFGLVDDCLITGYIDELGRGPDNSLIISDTKSRVKGTLPPVSQRLSAYHQLLVYHKLLLSMLHDSELAQSLPRLYEAFEVDPNRPFSNEFVIALENKYSSLSLIESRLRELLHKVAFKLNVSDEIQVSYRRSTGTNAGALIDTCRYIYDEQAFQELKEFSLQFWRGERDAIGVDPAERNKCRTCQWFDRCEWRATMDAAML